MQYRKLRALAVMLFTAFVIAPQPGATQTSKKKQTSSATRKKTTKKRSTSKKKTSRRPVRRAPAAPPVIAASPRSAAALAAAMAGFTGRVRSGNFGVMAVSLTRGDTLFAHNAGTPLLPASTMKMLTSAAVFEELGPQYQFSTDVLYDGTLAADGTLSG